MLIWPSTIPSRYNRTGFTAPYADGRLRADTNTGPGLLRRRTSTASRPVSGTIDMTAAEHARLERFYVVTTKGGVLPFWFPHATLNGFPLMTSGGTLLLNDGRRLLIRAWWLCQFGAQPPSPQPMAGGRMRVTVALSVLP